MIKRLLLSGAALVVGSTAALAADLPSRRAPPVYAPPPIPAFTWTGFYIGANGGGAFSGSRGATYVETIGGVADYATAFGGSGLGGGFGGAQIGYNQQYDHFVVGVEADAQGGGINATSVGTAPYFAETVHVATRDRIDFFGTVRGRFGYAFDRFLVYGTGGFAYGSVRSTQSVVYDDGFNSFASRNPFKSGYVFGGGVEYAITNNWSIKAEYLYVNLGSTNLVAPEFTGAGLATAFVSNGSVSHRMNTVKVGINYKFDWFAPAIPVVARY